MTTTSRAYSPPTHLYVGRTEDEVIEELQILLDNEEKSSRRKQPRIQQFNQKLRTMLKAQQNKGETAEDEHV